MRDLGDMVREMRGEMERNMSGLRLPYDASIVPVYMSYALGLEESFAVKGGLGGARVIRGSGWSAETEVRVGVEGKPCSGWGYDMSPVYPDADGSLAVHFWDSSFGCFKDAVDDFLERELDKLRIVSDTAGQEMFMRFPAVSHRGTPLAPALDEEEWVRRVGVCTGLLKDVPFITGARMEVEERIYNTVFINSEGSMIVGAAGFYDISMSAYSYTVGEDDSVPVSVHHSSYLCRPSELPGEDELVSIVEDMVVRLDEKRRAPKQKPLDRPALLDPDCTAQIIHVVSSERVVKRCSYDMSVEEDPPKKGDRVFPKFISLEDRPDSVYVNGPSGRAYLRGHTAYDDQGVRSQRLALVREGLIRDFPCGRDYHAHVQEPNGHGKIRNRPLPCITNLFVESARSASLDELKEELVGLCRKKRYDYGYLIGGVDSCDYDSEENFITLTPAQVYRVWAKNRKDPDTGKMFRQGDLQLVRGVEIVATPEMALRNLVRTGDDRSVVVPCGVDGISGVYQGPDMSIVSPSALFSRLELTSVLQAKRRPPILPHPIEGDELGGDDDG